MSARLASSRVCSMSVFDSLRRQIRVRSIPKAMSSSLLFAVATLILWWLWTPLGWIGLIATLWCAYFFRDPPRVTPLRERSGRRAGRRRVSFAGVRRAAARTRPRHGAIAARFDLHVGVRLPCESRAGRGPRRANRLSARPVSQRRPRQGERRQRTQRPRHRGAGGRFGVVQIAGSDRPAHRLLHPRRRAA